MAQLRELKARPHQDQQYVQNAVAALERRLRRALDAEKAAKARRSLFREPSLPGPGPMTSPVAAKPSAMQQVGSPACLHLV